MPKKLIWGQATAAARRKAPLPQPTSISTGWSLPKMSGQDKTAGASPAARSVLRTAAGSAEFSSHRYGASCSSVRRLVERIAALPLPQRDALDDRVEHHGVADKPLDVALSDELPFASQPGRQHQPVTGSHWLAKLDGIQPAEPDEISVEYFLRHQVIGAQLRGRLAHHHARHQWVAGHVAANPELVRAHVLVADGDLAHRVHHDDGGERFHLKSLRIDGANRVGVRDDASE